MFELLLKVYLCISILSFLFYLLLMLRTEHILKKKYKDKLKDNKSDKVGVFFAYIRLIILCLIPIYNIIVFISGFYLFVIDNEEAIIKKYKLDKAIENQK